VTRVLVIGAYGLIGAEITRTLLNQGIQVSGFGRDKTIARRAFPDIDWHFGDLRNFTDPGAWAPVVEGCSYVVNCAGALQDTPRDNLQVVHHDAVLALAVAVEASGAVLVQISAAGASPDASTNFMRSKAAGDIAIAETIPRHIIYRPTLVLSGDAYGGTEFLRALAAFPAIQPIALGKAKVQVISAKELAAAVGHAVMGLVPAGTYDLTASQSHSLREIVLSLRSWLGFPKPFAVIPVPLFVMKPAIWLADGLGKLGWRSPLRTNAIISLREGISGDSERFTNATEIRFNELDQILMDEPAHSGDQIAAQLKLLLPLLIAGLAIFWLMSGIIGLFRYDAAAQVLRTEGWAPAISVATVVLWSLVDIGLGLAVLVRKIARRALLGMMLVSLIYLVGASMVTPSLWLDPLGPLTKIIPSILLPLVCLAVLARR